MKRAATRLFKRQSKNLTFFEPGKDRSENPTPGATRMCESPGVARGVWSGLELTDTLVGYEMQ